MNFWCALLAYIIFSGIMFAQNFSKASANVKIKLIEGVNFNIAKRNLDFSVSLESPKGVLKSEPYYGIILHVSSKKTVNVMIDYGDIEVHKINAKGEKTDNQIKSEDFLLFHPTIQTPRNLTNRNDVVLLNTSTFAFDVGEKNSFLDLWIGGTLCLSNLSKDSIYSGTFALSLVYY